MTRLRKVLGVSRTEHVGTVIAQVIDRGTEVLKSLLQP